MTTMDTQALEFVTDEDLLGGRAGEGPAVELIQSLLVALGENPAREGLRRTPERVARMYQELLAGNHVDPVALINDAVFTTDYQGTVLVRNIEFYSLCEHHLLPFFGRAHVAYLPNGRVVGLSKIPRVVEMFARRLQIQEQLTQQVAEFLQETLQPLGVAVVIEGAHLCAMMRGVRQSDARMVTNTMLGAFAEDRSLRRDLMAQLGPLPDAVSH